MSDLENKFKKSKIFFEFINIWRRRNKDSNIKNYLYSNEYKYAFSLWKQTEEKQEWIEALTIGGDGDYDDLSSKVSEKIKTLDKIQIELKAVKEKISGVDRKFKETKPTMYFFSGLFTLFLTMVSATTIKINVLYLNNFNWWQTMLIIVGIIFAIFLVSIIFYLIAWQLFLRRWRN